MITSALVVVAMALDPQAAGSRFRPLDAHPQARGTEGRAVADLPFAKGRSFRTLDEYLAHLERGGAIDLPWWRRIGPEMYERVTTMKPARREVATRAELMRRYGFRR